MPCSRLTASLRCLLLFCLCVLAAAASATDTRYGDLHWRLLGPFRGGRVLTVAGVPGQPQHFYFGAVNGGVWETKDAGRTWRPIFDDQPVGSIGALAVAPSDPRVLYVGTGEADMRSDIAQGDGMYRSDDGGGHWTKIGLADSQQIGRILVDPRDAKTVFVAALGHPYGPNAERGVFRSRDAGAHWTRVLGKDADTGAIELAFEPGNPQVVYAAMWQARRTPWNVYPPASGPGSGLFKSTDGGDSWMPVRGNGFPEHVGRIGVAVAPNLPSRVYAIVDGDAGGLYRSDDSGAHWHLASGDPRIWQRGWYFGRITVDPQDADRVYALNTIVLRSDDGGAHFVALKGDGTGDDFHELWIDPQDSNRQILGVDQGAIVTMNGGRSWSSWHNQPTAQMYHVSTDNRFPYRVYGAQQDSGAVALPSATSGAATISMEAFKEVTAGGESGMIAPDPEDPDIVYGGTVEKLDLRTDQTHSVDPTLVEPDEIHRRTWTLPLVFSPRDPKVLYFGNQKLFRTDDGGHHWTTISPDLTREAPAVPSNLDAVTAANNLGNGPRRGVIYAIAPSPLDAKLLWIGTDDGLVWHSRDEGGHWNDVTPKALEAWSKVGMIEASHFDPQVAYAAVDRHRLDDRRPYIYRTRDGGRTWQAIVAGIRDGDFVNAVREDPAQRGLLYAATELGVYLSHDDGDHWQPLQINLPRTSVRDIDVHGNDVIVATHGRGFWVLDDVSPLRQMAQDAAAHDARATRLFAPATAIRVRPAGFTGTPLPKEEPAADNPPFGARIDYLLGSASTAPVQLTIRDSAGQLVRRYSSDDAPAKQDVATAGTAPEWFTTPSTLSTQAGLHRFLWPLRYPAPPALANGDAYADGAWAPPGRYTVALTVDGKTYTQPLTIAPDPRVSLAADGYAQQFAFVSQVQATQAQLATAKAQAARLHAGIQAARGTATPALAATLAALDAEVIAQGGLQEAPNPYNAWSAGSPGTRSFAFLSQSLGRIAQAADDADVAPSPDARSGYATLAPIIDGALARWQALLSGELPGVNAQLRGAGQAELQADAEPASAATQG